MSSNVPTTVEPSIIGWAAVAAAAAVFYRPLLRFALWLVQIVFLSPLDARIQALEKRFDAVDEMREDLAQMRHFFQRLEVALAGKGIVLQDVPSVEKRN